MNDTVRADELAYWRRQWLQRLDDVDAAHERGDAPYLIAAAQLRLKEATDRLEALNEQVPVTRGVD